MRKRRYKYERSDFQPLPVTLEHMDIHLNFADGNRVEGRNTLRITARKPIDSIRLDARNLDMGPVEVLMPGARQEDWLPAEHEYRRDENALEVRLPGRLEPGSSFSVRVAAACEPSDNILEGIYRDTTPPGCPQQYVSQFQQWGFQRVLPVFDDCTAKCTMTTTVEADARYTHLISNGNVCRESNPAGRPVPKPGDPSRQVITYVNDIPMAPYLFLVLAGTWDVLEDEITYPSGRVVKLEYLVPPGRTRGAEVPMKILKESVLWQGRTQDYEYTRDVYRTICMEKSNFGGMENVGNTTIITSAALIDEWTGDSRLYYAHGVIVHEFEHNQCGSDVTMETPFDMWLNEAFTVDVERQFLMSQFDPDIVRLDEIDSMRAPLSGPLAVEDGGHMGNIVREGFNDPDEVVDGVTYVKAAEVIRMLKAILGEDVFRKSKDLYFSRHDGGNANTDQFLACFEEVSGRDLGQFRKEWLYTIGYPKITATHSYDPRARRLCLTLAQERAGEGGMFHLPVELAAVDENGVDIPGTSTVAEMTSARMELTFDDIPEPAFVSVNRDCSFYGTFRDDSATREQLIRQVQLDRNRFNRVEAMRRLTDGERIRLIEDPSAKVSPEWLEIYAGILRDMSLPPGLKSYLVRIDEQSMEREYLPMYRERYAARISLMRAVARACMDDLMAAWNAVDTYRPAAEPKDGFEERMLKGTLLRVIIEDGTSATQNLAADHFRRAWNITDRQAGLGCVNISGHPRRKAFMAEAFEQWKGHLSGYLAYLSLIGRGVLPDVFEMIAEEEAREMFDIRHPGHNRALFLGMTGNNKMLWTDEGIEWIMRTAIRLAKVNQYTALRLIACFALVEKLGDDLKPKVINALETVRDEVGRSEAPSLVGRVEAYLGNA